MADKPKPKSKQPFGGKQAAPFKAGRGRVKKPAAKPAPKKK
jgi:hypothetical protein